MLAFFSNCFAYLGHALRTILDPNVLLLTHVYSEHILFIHITTHQNAFLVRHVSNPNKTTFRFSFAGQGST